MPVEANEYLQYWNQSIPGCTCCAQLHMYFSTVAQTGSLCSLNIRTAEQAVCVHNPRTSKTWEKNSCINAFHHFLHLCKHYHPRCIVACTGNFPFILLLVDRICTDKICISLPIIIMSDYVAYPQTSHSTRSSILNKRPITYPRYP